MSALPTVQQIQACMEANHTCPAIAYFMLTQHLDYPAALAYYREHFREYDLTEEDKAAVDDSEGRLNLVIMRSLGVDEPTAALLSSVPYGPDEPQLRTKCYYPTDEECVAMNPHKEIGRIMLMNNMTLEQAFQKYVRDRAEFWMESLYEDALFAKMEAFNVSPAYGIRYRATSQGTDTVIVTIHI